MLKSWGFGGGWVGHLDYSIISGPFLIMNFEFDQDHGPRPQPELDNRSCTMFCKTFPGNDKDQAKGRQIEEIETKIISQSWETFINICTA